MRRRARAGVGLLNLAVSAVPPLCRLCEHRLVHVCDGVCVCECVGGCVKVSVAMFMVDDSAQLLYRSLNLIDLTHMRAICVISENTLYKSHKSMRACTHIFKIFMIL